MGQKLRGLVGQGMSGRRSYHDATLKVLAAIDASSGSGSYTTTKACQALIYAIGPGGSGQGGANPAGGGGGGGAAFKRVRLGFGAIISYSVGAPGAASGTAPGNDGGDTTVTTVGVSVRAGGGKAGGAVTGVGGLGGTASGGDINRPGGAGGTGVVAGTSGGAGGGAGGAAGGGVGGGGGGGAGFSDDLSILAGGAGSDGAGVGTAAGSANGGGSGGTNSASGSGAGGAGRVVIYIIRAT